MTRFQWFSRFTPLKHCQKVTHLQTPIIKARKLLFSPLGQKAYPSRKMSCRDTQESFRRLKLITKIRSGSRSRGNRNNADYAIRLPWNAWYLHSVKLTIFAIKKKLHYPSTTITAVSKTDQAAKLLNFQIWFTARNTHTFTNIFARENYL